MSVNWKAQAQIDAERDDVLLIESEFSPVILYGIDNLRSRVTLVSPSGKIHVPKKKLRQIIYELREIDKELL